MTRFAPMAACLVAALLFGMATPLSKALLESSGPVVLAGLVYLGAALGVAPLAWRAQWAAVPRTRANVSRLSGASLFGGVMAPVLMLNGLRLTPAGSAALWLNLEAVATTILAWSLFREHIGRRVWLACGVIVAGGALLSLPVESATLGGALLIALACLCWGLDNNLTASIDGFTPAQVTFTKGIVAGTVNLLAGWWLEGRAGDWESVALALALGAVSYGVSLVLYIGGAQRLGAARSQLLFATSPFWGLLLAWLALGESVTGLQLSAGAIMAAGIAVMFTSRHGHAHRHAGVLHTHAHRHDDAHHLHVHDASPSSAWHTHAHTHDPLAHEHAHEPDLHHRHEH